MKRIILVILLVGIAAIAGIAVRSHSRGDGSGWSRVRHSDKQSTADVREEIRKTYELAPGARVEVSGINGWVKIETSDSKTADVYIERTGGSQEILNRRKITIDNSGSGLTIRGEKGDTGLLSRIFGSSPREFVTLKLPRQVSLLTQGVNGSVNVGEIDGPVAVHGVNGRVDIAQASGSAEFNGINGNVAVGVRQLDKRLELNGINGNIELRLSESVNADLEAHGMNGNVTSDLPNVTVSKGGNYGSYSAHIGKGGNSIAASGINGNIRLTRMMNTATATATAGLKSGS